MGFFYNSHLNSCNFLLLEIDFDPNNKYIHKKISEFYV